MEKEIINTKAAPAAIGPYSQGIAFGNLIFTSGQLPVDMATGDMVYDDVKKATECSIKNLEKVLEAKGSSLDKVIKTTVFIKDMNDFSKVNEVYGKFFNQNCPARSCVEVARLPKDVLVEIEAIAYV